MPSVPKRRFLKLKTGEVSLVDSPANEVEFLVTKNLEENVMGEQHGSGAEAERVEVEAGSGESDVAEVMKHVNAIVTNIATIAKAAAPAAPAVASAPAITAALGATEAADDDEDETVEKSIAAALKAAGIEPTDEQMKKMKAAGFDPSQKFPTAKKPAEKTTKAKAEPTAAAAVEETALTIEGLSELIQKAKKMTPTRVAQLKSAVEALKGLLEEIDTVPQGTNPGVSPSGGQQFGASGIKVLTEKAAGEPSELMKAVLELSNVVKSLAEGQKVVTEKVEAIEKARPASASLEAQGGTDTKVAKSALWSGIL